MRSSGPRRLIRAAGLLLAAATLSGCMSAVASVGGLGSDAAPLRPRDVQIFVDSTRPLKPDAAADGSARFSLATVSVPPGHRAGALEMASFGAPDRASDFALVGRRPLDAEAFRNAVATHLSAASARTATSSSSCTASTREPTRRASGSPRS